MQGSFQQPDSLFRSHSSSTVAALPIAIALTGGSTKAKAAPLNMQQRGRQTAEVVYTLDYSWIWYVKLGKKVSLPFDLWFVWPHYEGAIGKKKNSIVVINTIVRLGPMRKTLVVATVQNGPQILASWMCCGSYHRTPFNGGDRFLYSSCCCCCCCVCSGEVKKAEAKAEARIDSYS